MTRLTRIITITTITIIIIITITTIIITAITIIIATTIIIITIIAIIIIISLMACRTGRWRHGEMDAFVSVVDIVSTHVLHGTQAVLSVFGYPEITDMHVATAR